MSEPPRSARPEAVEVLRLSAIIQGTLDPLILIDAAGEILMANESCETAFGYAPSELIGRNVRDLMPEPYHSAHDDYLRNYHRTGETHILGRTRELPVLRKDGRQITVELSVSRIDIPGEGPLFTGSFRDVTARKEAERRLFESEQRYRAIFDGVVQFIGLLDTEGVLLEVNRAALLEAGVTREQVVGLPFWETSWWNHDAAEAERLRLDVRQAAGGARVRRELELRDRLQVDRVVDFSLTPIRNAEGEVAFLIPEGRDITAERRAQERQAAMVRAFAEIGESASLLAHEIKTPITSVNLALRAVAQHLGQDDRSVIEELVQRMQKLEKLMRRTLSFSRPLAIHRSQVELSALVESCAALLAPVMEAESVALEVEPIEGQAQLDRELIEEALTNLLRNATEAQDTGGRVRISVERAARQLRIHVDDAGPGIPAGMRASLTKPFFSTKTGGSGLGLAFVRKIAEAHGGRLEIGDSPLGGARFSLCLGR